MFGNQACRNSCSVSTIYAQQRFIVADHELHGETRTRQASCHSVSLHLDKYMSQVWVSSGLGIADQLQHGSSKEGVVLCAGRDGKYHDVQMR